MIEPITEDELVEAMEEEAWRVEVGALMDKALALIDKALEDYHPEGDPIESLVSGVPMPTIPVVSKDTTVWAWGNGTRH